MNNPWFESGMFAKLFLPSVPLPVSSLSFLWPEGSSTVGLVNLYLPRNSHEVQETVGINKCLWNWTSVNLNPRTESESCNNHQMVHVLWQKPPCAEHPDTWPGFCIFYPDVWLQVKQTRGSCMNRRVSLNMPDPLMIPLPSLQQTSLKCSAKYTVPAGIAKYRWGWRRMEVAPSP